MLKQTGKITAYLSTILLLALIFLPSSIAYAENPTEWPYGGKPDSSRMKRWLDRNPVTFKQQADFKHAQFSNVADFWYAQFSDDAFFTETQFLSLANFSTAQFSRGVEFSVAQFSDEVVFMETHFSGDADFSAAQFSKKADFRKSQFSKEAGFSVAQFLGEAVFMETHFSGDADFSAAQFSGDADFENAVFDTTFNVAGTKFEKGTDLRRTNLSKSIIFFDHHTFFPSGTLNVNWNQLQGRLFFHNPSCPSYWKWTAAKTKVTNLDSLEQHLPETLIAKSDGIRKDHKQAKAELDTLTSLLNLEQHDLTKTFYYRLRDNYLAQDDQASADKVMYELASKRAEYLREPLWVLYGWFMGWGYKPLRFVLTVFLFVVLPFSFLWYKRFYHRVVPLVANLNEEQKKLLSNPSSLQQKTFLKIFKYKTYNHREASETANFLARLWHVVRFSSSVLFSIRFNKDWIEMEDRAFLTWVTAEWALGIGLYVTFAILVKSYEFGYVKGLLGF